MSGRDPLLREIETELERGSLDSNLFERLATELVRDRGIRANHVSGGGDFGYDFELVFGEGEPGPGIVTTGDDAIGNLRRNLRRNSDSRPNATKKTYLVTSRSLTPRRRRNLHRAAEEEGYALLGICDRVDVAEYIYQHPQLAHDLLGLMGTPRVLSPVPSSSRPLVRLPLIGRDDALTALRGAEGDVILMGSPGSGKTAMLAELADSEEGLFLTDLSDDTAVANAIRETRPARVFIDDSTDPVRATRLVVRLRTELDADFSLVVTEWGRSSQLEQLLGPSAVALELEQLTRDEIVEVIHSVGIGGPTPLVREIVNQAEGVPGLAVELAQAAVQGTVTGVFQGDYLGALMRATIERLLDDPRDGRRAVSILGVMSLSGDAGLTIEEVAQGLGQSSAEIQALLRRLDAGGVVRPKDNRRISVRPRALRRFLIREVFFSSARLDYEPWLRIAPDFALAVRELAWASRAGAAVPNLMESVVQSGDTEAARILAAADITSAERLLRLQPSLALPVAREALYTAPQTVLPLLLDAAKHDNRPLHGSPDHPLRIVQDWVHGGVPGTIEALRRRRVLVDASMSWVRSGGPASIFVQVVCDAMTPQYQGTETDPGSGMTLTWSHGALTAAEVAGLVPVWDSILPILTSLEPLPWPLLLSACHTAAFPELGSGLEADVAATARSLAVRMACDLAGIARDHPGVLDRINSLLARIDDDHRFNVPEDYRILFGDVDHADWKAEQERRSEAIDRLVGEWSHDPARAAAHRLEFLQKEATVVESHTDNARVLCARLANLVSNTDEWLSSFVEEGLDPNYLEPFLNKVIAEGGSTAAEAVQTLLGTPANDAAIGAALRSSDIPDSVWADVAEQLERYAGYVETLAIRDEIPERNLRRLLWHESELVKASTAEGMWQGSNHGAIPDALLPEWREAVVRCVSSSYWLREILLTDPTFAEGWLRRRLEVDDWRALGEEANVVAAASAMSHQQRINVMQDLMGHILEPDLVSRLVGESVEMYEALCLEESLIDFRGAPFSRVADDTWRSFVVIALDHGMDARAIVGASTWRWGVRSGPESAHLQGLAREYEAWLADEDERVREIAEAAIEALKVRQARALREERQRAVEGWD